MNDLPYSSYQVIPGKIARRQDFRGNTMRGEAFPHGCGYVSSGAGSERPPNDAVYVVWSYATPIAWVLANGDGYVVPQHFSITTSKHKGQCWSVYTEAQHTAHRLAQEAAWEARKRLLVEREAYKINAEIDRAARAVRRRERMEAYVVKHMPGTIELILRSAS